MCGPLCCFSLAVCAERDLFPYVTYGAAYRGTERGSDGSRDLPCTESSHSSQLIGLKWPDTQPPVPRQPFAAGAFAESSRPVRGARRTVVLVVVARAAPRARTRCIVTVTHTHVCVSVTHRSSA